MRSTMLFAAAAFLSAACAANVRASTNAGGGGTSDTSAAETQGATSTAQSSQGNAPAQANAASAPAANASAPPLGEGCRFRCYVAQGGERAEIAPADEARLAQAFADTMGQFRGCDERRHWRRRSSPVINLRFDSQGVLAEEGFDLDAYAHDQSRNCMADVARVQSAVAGPPSSTVRCAEICERRKPERSANPKPAKKAVAKPASPKAAPATPQ